LRELSNAPIAATTNTISTNSSKPEYQALN
jgi:hypothetical protein